MYSGFVQDVLHWQRFTFSLGLRYDNYRFLVNGNQFPVGELERSTAAAEIVIHKGRDEGVRTRSI